ncbi:MAG TPA: c-type cytochrome domain-containing protein, partial [Polyangiaceae bacterium]
EKSAEKSADEKSADEKSADEKSEDEKPAATPSAAPSAAATTGPAVLATYCSKCHSAQKQKGKLRTDSVAALVKGGTLGPALVPGSPEQSLIVTRPRLPLTHEDHMPPKKEPQPSGAELAVLAAWVRAGPGGAAAGASDASSSASGESGAGIAKASASAGAAGDGAPGAAEAVAVPPGADSAASSNDGAPLAFIGSVQPLLRDKCGKCHIRDKPAGGLNVAQHQQLLEGGFTSPAVVPRDREKSLLLTRVLLPAGDDEHMPPDSEPQLTSDEISLLASWIDQGAPESPPAVAPPAVAPTAGGCAACSVPGGPRSRWLEAQAWTAFGATLLLAFRRRSI